jgi:hypothetical protein
MVKTAGGVAPRGAVSCTLRSVVYEKVDQVGAGMGCKRNARDERALGLRRDQALIMEEIARIRRPGRARAPVE